MQTKQISSRIESLFQVIRPTTFISPYWLQRELGTEFLIASETFQITGSFKFRAAYNLAANVDNEMLITASSGNFGQALACACKMLGKKCVVVMPANSAKIKIESTLSWGAEVSLVDTTIHSRASRVAELAAKYNEAYIASAYDNQLVIEGNSSLGFEIAKRSAGPTVIFVPIGGGGLTAGMINGVRESGRTDIEVYAAEPALANDASQSMARGEIVSLEQESKTIADGARTLSLGKHNFEVLKTGLAGIIEVPDDAIKAAVRTLFLYANLKVEPTGALAFAAFLSSPERFAGKQVVCIASGGNVDPALFSELVSVN